MTFVPSAELRTNPTHLFSPQIPFHSTLTVSPSLEQSRVIMNNSNIDQTTGTGLYSLLCSCSV
jgi:hypothetical protein